MKDMTKLADKIVAWLKNYAVTNNRKTFVVGVSGGVDSALVSTLCAMTGLQTHCVVLPCQSKQDGLNNASKHIQWLRSKFSATNNVYGVVVDLTPVFESFVKSFEGRYPSPLGWANTKSRLRMTALYQIATPSEGLVVGTGNKIEDYKIFFYTKYGDGAVDIAPIADLTKSEVRKMCRDLGVLLDLSEAIPTDGLWEDGRTDEVAIGATYEELEQIVELLEKNNEHLHLSIVNNMTPRQREVLEVYNRWHLRGMHKSLPIPTFKRIS